MLTTGRLLAIVEIWTALRPGFNELLMAAVIVGEGFGGPSRADGELNPSRRIRRRR